MGGGGGGGSERVGIQDEGARWREGGPTADGVEEGRSARLE